MDQVAAVAPRAVFSTKQAFPTYNGPLFLLSSMRGNNAFFQVFDDNGVLRTSSNELLSDVLAHQACWIQIWYDQSGHGRHAKQPDQARQPFLALKGDGLVVVDFKYNRFLLLPDATLPPGSAPFSVLVRHGDIMNPTGGILGSGDYSSKNAVNAIRRNGNSYVNYFWDNDLHTTENTYKPNNTISFSLSSSSKHSAFIRGVLDMTKEKVTHLSSPQHTTIGKTFGEDEYLNGELEFLYIMDEPAPLWVSYQTGQWQRSPV